MPRGREDDARAFYAGLLGLAEIAKPPELAARLADAGLEVRPDTLFPGHRRFYTDDPFGNRLEFLTRL